MNDYSFFIFIAIILIVVYFLIPKQQDRILDKYPHMTRYTDWDKYRKTRYLFDSVVTVLNKHQVGYWAMFGTLLGLIRDQGILPWDYDVDLAIDYQEAYRLDDPLVKKDLADLGLCIKKSKNNTFKIYFLDDLPKGSSEHYYIGKTHLDIYQYRETDGMMSRSCHENWYPMKCYRGISHDKIPSNWIYPLRTIKINQILVQIPNRPIPILKQHYGQDWLKPKYTHV
jgi:phosphorylcholine metabolism protein LicD